MIPTPEEMLAERQREMTTVCPVDGCGVYVVHPGAAWRGAELAMAEHQRAVHVREGSTSRPLRRIGYVDEVLSGRTVAVVLELPGDVAVPVPGDGVWVMARPLSGPEE